MLRPMPSIIGPGAVSVSTMQTSIRTDTLAVLSVMVLVILSPLALAILPWKSKVACGVAALCLSVSAGLLVLLSVIFDGMLGLSASWGFTSGVFILGSVICLAVRLRHRSLYALVMIGEIAVFVVVQHFMDLSPVKPYGRFFAAIEPGLTEADVLTLLQHEFPDGFRFSRPVRRDSAQGQMEFFLDPTESAWNAEGIFVRLSGGRVVSKQYSRD